MNERGYTLVEILFALAVFSVIAIVLLMLFQMGTLFQKVNDSDYHLEREAIRLHLFFQDQLLKSDKVYIKNNKIYLQDRDIISEGYYNYYQLDANRKILFRYKSKDRINNISGGTAQFAKPMTHFMFVHQGDGTFILTFVLENNMGKIDRHYQMGYQGEIIYE